MGILDLIKSLKNNLYVLVDGLVKDCESTRVKLVYLSMAMFAYSVIYGLSNPSATASTAITATASVFSIAIGAYVGSNSMYYIKGQSNQPSQTNSLPKDKVDPEAQSD